MWSLKKIFKDISENKFNPDDVIVLIKEISTHFRETTSDDLIDVMTEIAPAEDLKNISSQYHMILSKFPDNMLRGETGFALTILQAVIQNKISIVDNKTSLHDEIKELESQHLDKSHSGSVSNTPLSKKIIRLKHIIQIADQISNQSTDARIAQLQVDAYTLEKIINHSPANIKDHPVMQGQTIGSLFKKFQQALGKLIFIEEPHQNKEIRKLFKACESDAEILLMAIASLIRTNIDDIKSNISAHSLQKIEKDYENMAMQLDLIIKKDSSTTVHQMLSEKAVRLAEELITATMKEPHSPPEVTYRKNKNLATSEILIEFPASKFKYFITPKDLRDSKNIFIDSQVKLTEKYFGKIEDEYKFILSGKPADTDKQNEESVTGNLEQIKKDVHRELKINGVSYTGKNLNRQELINLLDKTFNETDVNNLMKHFDQGLSLMLAGGVAQGLNTGDMQQADAILAAQPDTIEQNMYPKYGMAFRTAELTSFKLIVPMDDDVPAWKFKMNLKALSWISDDGFVVESIATDNALICSALINSAPDQGSSPPHMLKDIVMAVLDAEALAKKTPEQEKLLGLITEFKTGVINFEALTKEIKILHDSPPASTMGMLLSSIAGMSPKVTLKTALAKILEIAEALHAQVKAFEFRVPEVEAKSAATSRFQPSLSMFDNQEAQHLKSMAAATGQSPEILVNFANKHPRQFQRVTIALPYLKEKLLTFSEARNLTNAQVDFLNVNLAGIGTTSEELKKHFEKLPGELHARPPHWQKRR